MNLFRRLLQRPFEGTAAHFPALPRRPEPLGSDDWEPVFEPQIEGKAQLGAIRTCCNHPKNESEVRGCSICIGLPYVDVF